MTKLRHFVFALLTLPLLAAAATDPSLLRLVMPDAKVVAGLQVTQTKNSAFGQFILSHMQVEDDAFKKFMAQTGFDPRRDVSEIVMASNWEQATPQGRWLVIARGTFNIPTITAAAMANGGATTAFQGVDILTYAPPAPSTPQAPTQNGIAFFDSSNAIMGDIASVKAAIQRQQTKAATPTKLMAKVRALSAKNDFWFVTLVPISEFAGAMPDPNLSSAMKGNLLAAVHEASGGIRFGPTVDITGEAVTRSEKDALALVDVFKFVAGLVQTNRQNDATVGKIADWLDTMDLKTKDNVMTMSVAIPEKQLEQMLDTMRQQSRQARKKPAAPQVN
ncbi:MAG TPA: hypothetical protein VGV35_00340 [Bryobacteraceae bacterium]|nr:hypothetical protein [Bryobacteraceae bacterium]